MNRNRVGVLAAGVLLVATGCWRQDGGDAAHTGFDPAEHKVTAANVATLSRTWTTATGNPSTSPVISGSSVFAAGPDGVTAYDIVNGSVRWTVLGPDPTFGSMSFRNLTIDDVGVVVPYGHIGGGGYSTLDKATGAEIANVGGFHQLAGSSKVYRADVSADLLGSYGSGGPIGFNLRYGLKRTIVGCCDLSGPRPTEPSIVGRFVVIGEGTKVMGFSLDACAPSPSTGICAADWTADLGSTVGTPVGIDGVTVAITIATGDVQILNVSTGARIRTLDVPAPTATTPAIGRASIFVGGTDGKVHAFAKAGCGAATCPPAWSVDTGTGAAISHQPAIGADVVYAGTANGRVAALSTTCATASCSPLWTATVSDSATSGAVMGIAIDDGSVYATASTGPVGSIAVFRLP